MDKERVQEIFSALQALGIKGKVAIMEQDSRSVVYVDGQQFGVWDHVRQTFVD